MEIACGADGRMEEGGKEPCTDGDEQKDAVNLLHRFEQGLCLGHAIGSLPTLPGKGRKMVNASTEFGEVHLLHHPKHAAYDGRAYAASQGGTEEILHAHRLTEVEGEGQRSVGCQDSGCHDDIADGAHDDGQTEGFLRQVVVDDDVEVCQIEDVAQEGDHEHALIGPLPAGKEHIDDQTAEQGAEESHPVERDDVERVVAEDAFHQGMLEDVFGSQQRVAQHDDADEHEHHGVAAKEVVEDVGMMNERSAPTVQDEGDDPDERGEADVERVEPVVVFAIGADKHDAQTHHSPHEHAEPIDAIERQGRHDALVVVDDERGEHHQQECLHDGIVHVFPGLPEGEIDRHDARKVDGAVDDEIDVAEEDGHVAFGRDPELDSAVTLEGAPDAEEARHEAGGNQQWHGSGVGTDDVGQQDDGAAEEQRGFRLDCHLQSEHHAEEECHAHQRGIASHLDVFLQQLGAAHHLGNGCQIDSA